MLHRFKIWSSHRFSLVRARLWIMLHNYTWQRCFKCLVACTTAVARSVVLLQNLDVKKEFETNWLALRVDHATMWDEAKLRTLRWINLYLRVLSSILWVGLQQVSLRLQKSPGSCNHSFVHPSVTNICKKVNILKSFIKLCMWSIIKTIYIINWMNAKCQFLFILMIRGFNF